MREPFADFLQELGEALGTELFVDRKGACSLRMHGHLHVQLQKGPQEEEIWMVAEVAELPPGRFREEVLKEALKANDAHSAMPIVWSYVSSGNRLMLASHFPLGACDGKQGAAYLSLLIEAAEQWKRALASGRSSP